jgi:AraC family transcriptional regulator
MEPDPTIVAAPPRTQRRALCVAALQPVLRMVEAALDTHIGVADMAGVVGLSQFHFCREFRRVMGISPYAYIKRRRIARAGLLLAGSRLPIAAIGRAVGFKTHAHFTNAFAQVEKKTPTEYRNLYASARGVRQPLSVRITADSHTRANAQAAAVES